MKCIIASNNPHKIREIQEILPNFEFVSLEEAGIQVEVEETGSTFAENAILKAETIRDMTGLPVIADDSGICVPALGGKPGILSARYIGVHGDDIGNLNKLLDDMADLYDADRYAYYECAAAFAAPGKETIVTKGVCGGIVIRQPQGDGGFGYDPVFYIPYMQKTLAELPAVTKNHMSHRYHTFTKLAELIQE